MKKPEIEIIYLENKDVITLSGPKTETEIIVEPREGGNTVIE